MFFRPSNLKRTIVKTRTIVAVLTVSVVLIAAAGVAVAAWQSTGSGAASLHTATAQNSTISAVSAVALYPGASKTALVSVTNPNPYPVVVTAISAGTSAAQTGSLGTCPANSVTSDALAPIGGAVGVLQSDGTTMTIPPSGSASYQLTTHMVANADNACQGLTMTLPLTSLLDSNA
jgi:hypothetical protein